uniref:Acyl-CoA-binding domain-containing protein 6 n=1 Tax=Heterorhabditis bacteriophora TaxID=37862 RepID=A0A1I7X746_HETBA
MFAVQLARIYQSWIGCKSNNNRCATVEDFNEDFMDKEEENIDQDVRARFKSAADYLPNVIGRLDTGHITQFYALYKQATAGPANPVDRPSVLDMKGRRKFDAWAELGEMSKETAMKTYVAKMDYMDLGWDPTINRSAQGFGQRPSRMAATDEMTALHWAIDSGCDRVVQFLIENGADVNAVDPEGNTPLHFGSIFLFYTFIVLCISKIFLEIVPLSLFLNYLYVIFVLAAYCHRIRSAEQLITAGADRTLQNHDGQTASEACDEPNLAATLRA